MYFDMYRLVGRMNDSGKDGRAACVEMQSMIDLNKSSMRLLVASIRSPEDLSYLASRGCNTFTISPKIFDMLFDESLTKDASDMFEEAAKRMGAGSDNM